MEKKTLLYMEYFFLSYFFGKKNTLARRVCYGQVNGSVSE